MNRTDLVPRIVAAVGLAVCGAGLAIAALIWGSIWTGAGHGTGLPADVFAAPGNFGLLVWPVSFAMMALPRRLLPFGLVAVLALISGHALAAYHEYQTNEIGRAYLHKIDPAELRVYAAAVVMVEVISPIVILVRMGIALLLNQRSQRARESAPSAASPR